MEEKRARLREQGKAVRFLPTYATQHLPEPALRVLVEKKEMLQERIIMLMSGEELDEGELMVQLHKDIYFALDNDVSVVHLRRFWWNDVNQRWAHQRRGVSISLDEGLSALEVIADLTAQYMPDLAPHSSEM